MVGFDTQPAAARYCLRQGEGGAWVILDRERDGVVVLRCEDAQGAEVIAALMNGDFSTLINADMATLSRCRAAIGLALRVLRPHGRPSVGAAAFPQF